ncbi:hypothetical protein LSO9J_20024 [Candidatus Liberibacter solanacearum]
MINLGKQVTIMRRIGTIDKIVKSPKVLTIQVETDKFGGISIISCKEDCAKTDSGTTKKNPKNKYLIMQL